MANSLDIRGFLVPETPYRESNVIPQLTDTLMQKQRMDYMMQKEKEADDWKKLGLIQDLTDLSKHQTGSDVANAIGNQKAGDIFQKYVAAAKQMSPNELAANIQKDMGSLVTSMDGIKTELLNADQQMQALKKIYPNLDIAALTKDSRADVINRHLKSSNEFYNPIEIQPTQIDLSNPRYLSKYLPNTQNLDKAITNPQGLDPTEVLVGTPYENITYKGKIPFWRQPNFTEEDMKKGGGFLKKGSVPQMQIKSENLPSEFLPSLKNNPRKMVDYPTYKQFYDAHPIEVEKGTADMFGEVYDKMDDHEKELAQRDFLYTKISALDRNNFYPSTSTHPSASMIKIWQGGGNGSGSKGGGITINEIYPRIVKAMQAPENSINLNGRRIGTTMNGLDSESQKLIFDAFGGRKEDLNETNTFLADKNGVPTLYRVNEDGHPQIDKRYEVGSIPQTIDVKAQVGAPEKRERIKDIKSNQQSTVRQTESDSYSRKELKAAGWSDAQIQTAVKAGKIKVND